MYDRLTAKERFLLVLEALAREDDGEAYRLANTCPRITYTQTLNELAYANRLRASRQITTDVCLVLAQLVGKLMLAKTLQEHLFFALQWASAEFVRGYDGGWKDGSDHARRAAGGAGPFPSNDGGGLDERGEETAEELGAKVQEAADGDPEADLDKATQLLAVQVQTVWEAFSGFCRTELGLEPGTLLLAWFPPMVSWIEEAMNAADGVRVDADVLEEYETALTNAWRELLREEA